MGQVRAEISQKFNEMLSACPTAKEILSHLSTEGDLLLFGGVVRDLLYFNEPSRDIDIVVDAENTHLDAYFEGIPYSKNRFGGYKFTVDGKTFDIWSLPVTWAYSAGIVKVPRAENLIDTVFLNIDSVAYNLNTQELYDKGLKKAIETQELDIVLYPNPFPDLNVLRALVFKKKYNYSFSLPLSQYINDWTLNNKDQAISLLQDMQASHYGENHLNHDEITSYLNNITEVDQCLDQNGITLLKQDISSKRPK